MSAVDIKITQGVDGSESFEIPGLTSSDTVVVQVRMTPGSTDVLHEWSTLHEIPSVAVSDGSAVIEWTYSETMSWFWKTGVYDVLVISNGVHARPYNGRVSILPAVTRI